MSSIVFGLGAVDTFFIPTVQNFLAEVETLQGIPTRKRTSPSSAADRKLSPQAEPMASSATGSCYNRYADSVAPQARKRPVLKADEV